MSFMQQGNELSNFDLKVDLGNLLENDLLSEEIDEKIESQKITTRISLERAVYDYQINGIKEAFDYVYSHYKPILDRLAWREKNEDLSQELSEVLWNAVKKYNFDPNVKFNTFFWTCARNHMGTQKIRRDAQKRSGAKKVQKVVLNHETGEEEVITEIIKTKVVSLQSLVTHKDSETELGELIESKIFENDFKMKDLDVCLKDLFESGLIKEKEITAVKMIMQGFTLFEIGQRLNGITAPAVHIMLRRLGERKKVRKQILDILL